MPISVVTGATGGISRWIVLGLARAGHTMVGVGRNRQRGNDVSAWIGAQAPSARVDRLVADLSSLAATCDVGLLIGSRHPAVNVLVNDAGVFCTARGDCGRARARHRRQNAGIVANVVHPGAVATGLVRAAGPIGLAWRLITPFLLTEEQGADTPLHAALSAELEAISGTHVKTRQVVQPNGRAHDAVLARQV